MKFEFFGRHFTDIGTQNRDYCYISKKPPFFIPNEAISAEDKQAIINILQLNKVRNLASQ